MYPSLGVLPNSYTTDEEDFLLVDKPPNKISGVKPKIIINCSGTGYDEALLDRQRAIFDGKKPESRELISSLNKCIDNSINIRQYDEGLNKAVIDKAIKEGKKFSQLNFQLDGPGTKHCGVGYKIFNSRAKILFDKLTGIGCTENIRYAVELVMTYLQELYEEQMPSAFVLIGWSRGGITALMLAVAFERIFPEVPVYIFAIDPVAGPFSLGKERDYKITPNIKEMCVVIHGSSGHSMFYEPLWPKNLEVEGADVIFELNAGMRSDAIYKWRPYPGKHNSGVINLMDPDSPEKNAVYKLVASWLTESLIKWDVKLLDIKLRESMLILLNNEEKLELYKILFVNLENSIDKNGIREWAIGIMQKGYINSEHKEIASLHQPIIRHNLALEFFAKKMLDKKLQNKFSQKKIEYFFDDVHEKMFSEVFPEIYSKIRNFSVINDEFDMNYNRKLSSLPLTYRYVCDYKLSSGNDSELFEMYTKWNFAKLERQKSAKQEWVIIN